MPAVLGVGAHEVLAAGGAGQVAAVFAKAAYLRLPAGLVALTGPGVPDGPVHARTALALSALRARDPVVATPSAVQAGPLVVDLTGAEVWRGRLPTAAELDGGRALAVRLLADAPPSSLEAAAVRSATGLVEQADLDGLADRLGGLGPGLTPAGDDVLAGVLLVAAARWGESARPLLCRVAESVRTNDIAAAFLRWAARGQSIEPVHRFLLACAAGDAPAAAAALDALVSFGHSSGADLALGLRLAVDRLPANGGRRAEGGGRRCCPRDGTQGR